MNSKINLILNNLSIARQNMVIALQNEDTDSLIEFGMEEQSLQDEFEKELNLEKLRLLSIKCYPLFGKFYKN